MSRSSRISEHYTHGALLETLRSALPLDTDSESLHSTLAAIDAFHSGGREATQELLDEMSIPRDARVLDIGCGLGGTARLLALEYEVRVTAVDLCEEYCAAAEMLTQRLGLEDRVTFLQGSATALPVDSGGFDLAISEHVQMNVPDKECYLQEVRRVLGPDGRFAFFEIFSGPNSSVRYPVPWSEDGELSFLVDTQRFRRKVEAAGFDVLSWHDATEEMRSWFEQRAKGAPAAGPDRLGLHLLMGANAPQKMRNMIRNLREERITVVRAVVRRPGS